MRIIGLTLTFFRSLLANKASPKTISNPKIAIRNFMYSASTKVNFNDPVSAEFRIFVRSDSDIKTVEDLKGKEVAASKGSTYATTAEKYTTNVKTYDSDITALKALSGGRHDAVITDFVTGKEATKEGFDIKGRQLIERSEQAIVLPNDNPQLLIRINEALENLREDGTLAAISKKYFGEDITTRQR